MFNKYDYGEFFNIVNYIVNYLTNACTVKS